LSGGSFSPSSLDIKGLLCFPCLYIVVFVVVVVVVVVVVPKSQSDPRTHFRQVMLLKLSTFRFSLQTIPGSNMSWQIMYRSRYFL
jgi:sensor domain CHASE-containing protein